jgi:hypothetical protein
VLLGCSRQRRARVLVDDAVERAGYRALQCDRTSSAMPIHDVLGDPIGL